MNGTGPAGIPTDPGYGAYPCRDGSWIALGIAHEDRFWRDLCTVTGLRHLAELGHDERVARRQELVTALERALGARNARWWLDALTANDVPCAPVNDLDAVAGDRHVRARGLIVELPGEPARRHVRQPLRFDGHAPRPRLPCPRLGEHTRDVLNEAGVAAEVVEAIVERARAAHPSR